MSFEPLRERLSCSGLLALELFAHSPVLDNPWILKESLEHPKVKNTCGLHEGQRWTESANVEIFDRRILLLGSNVWQHGNNQTEDESGVRKKLGGFPDVVVLLPGISGSALAKDGKEIWGLSGGALVRAFASGGSSIDKLALSGDDPSLDDLGDGITATRLIPDLHMIPGLWKIDGYGATTAKLVGRFALQAGKNYFEFPYDWRRDNRVAALRLQRSAQKWLKAWRSSSGNVGAKLVLIGHSMGGVIARYFLEVLQGWQDTRALITFGTPYRGSLNAVGYLANGYAKSIGPLELDFSETIRTFTALYQLLPIYPCITASGQQPVRVSEASSLPNIDRGRAVAALAFHEEIRTAQEANERTEAYRSGYTIFPIVGIEQPTFQSAVLQDGRLDLHRDLKGRDDGGDGTVPRPSATPIEFSNDRREMFVVEQHASLQNFGAVLDQVTGILSGEDMAWPNYEDTVAVQTALGLDLQDVYQRGPVTIAVKPSRPAMLEGLVCDLGSGAIIRAELRPGPDGNASANVMLPPGAYRITCRGDETVSPVTDSIVVI